MHHTRVGDSDYRDKGELIDRLMQAIEDRCVVFLTYQSLRSTEPTTYDTHPYGITYHRGSLYLVGFSPQHDKLRTWKIDRLSDVTIERLPFQRPVDFDLSQYFASSFGVWHGEDSPDSTIVVTIRFAPSAARYVQEKQWHAEQKLALQPDGSLLAEFRLESTIEIKSWILSFGSAAVVLSPESLQAEIRQEVDKLAEAYTTVGRDRGAIASK